MGTEPNYAAVCIALAGVVAAWYLLMPWLIYFTQKMNGDPRIVLFDLEKSRPPQRTAHYLDEAGEVLMGLGYEPQPCVGLPDPMPHVKAILQLWIHPEDRDAALVSAIYGTNPQAGASLQIHYVEFLTKFVSSDIALIQTNNTATIGAFPELPNELTFKFPQVQDVGRLQRLHRRLVELHAPRARKTLPLVDEFHSDLPKYIRHVLAESYRKQEATGYLQPVADSDAWRPTVRGAYLMTWSQMWPMTAFLKLQTRASARRLLAELEPAGE